MSEPAPKPGNILAGPQPDAAALVHLGLRARPTAQHGEFLRGLIAHAAAGIVATEGDEAAIEACRRVIFGIRHRPHDLEAGR